MSSVSKIRLSDVKFETDCACKASKNEEKHFMLNDALFSATVYTALYIFKGNFN